MKKSLSLLAAVTLLALPCVSLASIDTNLQYGSHGQEVTELQEFLISNNYLTGDATGNFYSLTLKGVKLFQSDHSIPSTGYVGSLTRAEINSELSTSLASSTDEEVQETGTTTSFLSDAPNPVITALQVQNQLLQQQIQAQQQTNTILQNQQTNQNTVQQKIATVSVPLPDFGYRVMFGDGTLDIGSTVDINNSSVSLTQGSSTINLTDLGPYSYGPGEHCSYLYSQNEPIMSCNYPVSQFTFTDNFDPTQPYNLTFTTVDGRDFSQDK